MNAIGKGYTGVLTRTFESAEIRAQHLDLTKATLSNRVSNPNRCRIEPKNVANLKNQPRTFCQLDQFLRVR